MEKDLLGFTTRKLLKKFGAGNHKPGSGSAAAFQGMISAKLLVTVIQLANLTTHRAKYLKFLPELLDMRLAINDRIFPELANLFQDDSIQFGKTISLRKRRNAEADLVAKNHLARRALHELKVSIDIPLKIAELCIELARIAAFVFDNGFQSARGDTQVALSGAVSGLGGCLSIVHLNLLSFGSDEYNWIKNVVQKCDALRREHSDLNQIANSKIEKLTREVKDNTSLYNEVDHLLNDIRSYNKLTNTQIEDFTSNLQNIVWKNRRTLWGHDVEVDHLQVLAPSLIFKKMLGYAYDDTQGLDFDFVNDELVEIAGVIDQESKLVQISNHTSQEIQNFTAAHELAHALLHRQPVLHRDIPLDGSPKNRQRPVEEEQADRFASYFLMPRKLIRRRFKELFFTDRYKINSDTTSQNPIFVEREV